MFTVFCRAGQIICLQSLLQLLLDPQNIGRGSYYAFHEKKCFLVDGQSIQLRFILKISSPLHSRISTAVKKSLKQAVNTGLRLIEMIASRTGSNLQTLISLSRLKQCNLARRIGCCCLKTLVFFQVRTCTRFLVSLPYDQSYKETFLKFCLCSEFLSYGRHQQPLFWKRNVLKKHFLV